jgi:predicted Zn-dependent protease with MMP-like domain
MKTVPSISASASASAHTEASSSSGWSELRAPSIAEFEVLAQTAFDNLPDEFRALCSDLLINVTEFPDDDVVKELDAESPFDILGLFSGVGLPQQGWAEHDESLGAIVTHVLVHEIGHHFGFSDEDMEAIEQAAG